MGGLGGGEGGGGRGEMYGIWCCGVDALEALRGCAGVLGSWTAGGGRRLLRGYEP